MNQKLIGYLELNKALLLEQWRCQFITQISSRKMRMIDAYLQTIEPFYLEVLLLLEGERIEDACLLEKLSDSLQNESHSKLPYLLEIFLSGEEAICTHLLSQQIENHPFSYDETACLFESLRKTFDLLIRRYANTFCTECAQPLMKAHHHVIQLGHLVSLLRCGLYPKAGFIYDD